ncbi:MAG: cupin domain-containing protein [bacterium]|jgi:mannose-6-phosphate isomerase-like protein (cupin superfamily)
MIIKRKTNLSKTIVDCHHGKGVLWCTEMLADYTKTGSGFKYIHDNHLEPGASIGEHHHENDEEIYVILSGHGKMNIDGGEQTVEAGDICLTRCGHSHDLTNGLEGPMHFLVICTNT